MALPTKSAETREEKLARRQAAQDEALLREVDDAVRQGDLEDFTRKYGKALLAVVILLIAAFGGYLYWQAQRNAARETYGEILISALDHVQVGNLQTASETLEPLVEGDGAAAASARMLRAGIAAEQNQPEEAARIFAALAGDEGAPQALRDLARIRMVATRFDTMDKAQVVSELRALAVPGEPFFGSAGELVAMAYLEQGKRAEAGALFAQIAQADDVPESLRSRARQMAGVLGVDAIEDVDALLEQQGVERDGEAMPAGGA